MPRVCTICNHAQREQINFDLMAHEITYEQVADKYGLSKSSVKRHVTNHLRPLVQRINKEKDKVDEAMVLRARDVYTEIMKKLPTVIDQTTIKECLRAAEGFARISGEDNLPSQVIFVWGKGLEKEDDMELTNDLEEFEVTKSKDRGEDELSTEEKDNTAPV